MQRPRAAALVPCCIFWHACAMRLATIALCIAMAPATAEPQAQALADALLMRSEAPGTAAGWIDKAESGIGVAGLRAKGHEPAVRPDDLWHIGSNTKSMTATLAARLVEKGVLSWDATVRDHLATLDPHPGLASATLERLLTHRAGMPANIGMLASLRLSGTDATRDARADRRAYARRVLGNAPETDGFLYSNAGYVVAGAMMEAATGDRWEQLMRREVFAPLGMGSAGFGPPGQARDTPDQPWGHGGLLNRPRPPSARADNIPALGPAGRVHLSVADHLRYLRAHMEHPPEYLSADSWARLQSDPDGDGYAMGWALRAGRLAHTGSNTMWFHRVEIDRAARRAILLATNSGDISKQAVVLEDMADGFFAQ